MALHLLPLRSCCPSCSSCPSIWKARGRADTLPAKITVQLITGMTSMLAALSNDSAAAVINANNALLAAVLDISNITTLYLNHRKEDPAP